MGATVSVINEEISRPLDGTDVEAGSGVDVNDVKRLRELLHTVYKGEYIKTYKNTTNIHFFVHPFAS